MRIYCALLTAASLCAVLPGCANYVTPGGAASLRLFTGVDARDGAAPTSIQNTLARVPAANLPTTLAVAHIQGPFYDNHRRYGSYGSGAYTLVTAREVETDDDMDALRRLDAVSAVVGVGRLVLPERLETDEDLRRGAAALRADVLLVYTFDTSFHKDDWAPPLGFVTLGLFPTRVAHVRSTAAAVVIDTRTGFVYATAESTDKASQAANGWTSEAAIDDARVRAERRAFEGLLTELSRAWPGVVRTIATREPVTTPAPASTLIAPPPSPSGPTYPTSR